MKIGIYQTYWGRVGGGQRFVAVVAEMLAQDHTVEIVHHHQGFDPRAVEEPMDVDLSGVSFRYVPVIDRPNWETQNPFERLRLEREVGKEISEPYDLFIDSSDIPPLFCHARTGVLLTHFPLVTFDEYHGREGTEWESRSALKRFLTGTYQKYEWKQRYASYDFVWVNSEYTKYWTKRFWGADSETLNPPLREGLSSQPKEKVILSIGAFRSAQHKKQTTTLDAFKSMCDEGLRGWKYVMVGASGATEDDLLYLSELKDSTADYPIEIRENVSGEELKQLLETSEMLWHSMGFGVDPVKNPAKLEHFGMVATEAMAAGCIPVVFNGGGLKEIVSNGESGFLWDTQNDLIEQSSRLIADDQLRERLRKQAMLASQAYGNSAFKERLFELLKPIVGEFTRSQQPTSEAAS